MLILSGMTATVPLFVSFSFIFLHCVAGAKSRLRVCTCANYPPFVIKSGNVTAGVEVCIFHEISSMALFVLGHLCAPCYKKKDMLGLNVEFDQHPASNHE